MEQKIWTHIRISIYPPWPSSPSCFFCWKVHPALPFSDNSDIEEHDPASLDLDETDVSHQETFSMELEESRPLIYASLPPSPISSPTLPPVRVPTFPTSESQGYEPPFSLWDYLTFEELLATDFDSHQELKWERVSNFLSIPLAMEKASPISSITSKIHVISCNCQIDNWVRVHSLF